MEAERLPFDRYDEPLRDRDLSHDWLAPEVRSALRRSIASAQLLVGMGPRACCSAIHVGLSMRARLISW